MVEIIVLILMVVTMLWAAFGPVTGMGLRKSRKLEPHEFDWGNGKDLSQLLLPRDKMTELEKWYYDNHSKDGKIKELNTLVAAKSALISTLRTDLQRVQKENEWLKNYAKHQKPAMILDKPKPRRGWSGIPISEGAEYLEFDEDISEREYQKFLQSYGYKIRRENRERDLELYTMDGSRRSLYNRLIEDDEWDY